MITFGITVADEEYEFRRLLDGLLPFLKEGESVVVLADRNKVTHGVESLCDYFGLRLEYFDFKNNFSDFKNYLISLVETKYLFQLDADEQVTPTLLRCVRDILRNGEHDCVWIPRINIVHNHTAEDVERFGWAKKGEWILFPDYQIRVFEVTDSIRWHLPVHEEVIGYKNHFVVHAQEPEFFSLLHVKTIEKQREQNGKYDSIK
jgi:glycosyltransferase involved in cell wall biosynthesis